MKRPFFIQAAAAGVTLDARPNERYVISKIVVAGTVSAFTISNIGGATLDFGADPFTNQRFIDFPDGCVVGDASAAVVVTTTGGTKCVVFGYIVNDITA